MDRLDRRSRIDVTQSDEIDRTVDNGSEVDVQYIRIDLFVMTVIFQKRTVSMGVTNPCFCRRLFHFDMGAIIVGAVAAGSGVGSDAELD